MRYRLCSDQTFAKSQFTRKIPSDCIALSQSSFEFGNADQMKWPKQLKSQLQYPQGMCALALDGRKISEQIRQEFGPGLKHLFSRDAFLDWLLCWWE